jgi:hypothetical protein
MEASMSDLTVPASFFYYQNNKASLDILYYQTTPPHSFSLEQVIEFHKAKASLTACKYEYYEFMTRFYQQVWGQALIKFENILTPLKVKDELLNTYPGIASIDKVWEEGDIHWLYRTPYGDRLWLSCWTDNSCLLSINCAATSKGTTDWQLGQELCKKLDAAHWNQSIEEGGNIFLLDNDGLSFTEENPDVDVASLTEIATNALADMLK